MPGPTLSPTTGPSSAGGAGPTERPTPASGSPGSVPADGTTLRRLGFSYGPAAFTLPRTATATTAVDQPNVVVLVLSRPEPSVVLDYLRTELPRSGFVITAQDEASQTLTFAGQGWTGSVTATGWASAIRLSPGA